MVRLIRHPRCETKILCVNSHERLVVVSNLEDVEIVLGVYEVLDRAVLVRHGHHAGQVLQEELQLATQVWSMIVTWKPLGVSTLTLPRPPWAWPILKTHG